MTSALSTVLSIPGAPGFIYLHHPHTPTSACLSGILPSGSPSSSSRKLPLHVQASAIECNTARLLYNAILYRLADVSGTTSHASEVGEVSTWDGFARGLRAIYATWAQSGSSLSIGVLESGDAPKAGKKGKGKAKGDGHDIGDMGQGTEEPNWVISITHAERLPRVLGGQWAVITRLSELVGIPLTVILASQIPWDTLRPHAADAPEPIHIYIPAPTRAEVLTALLGACSHPLWPHFLNLFLATFLPLTTSLEELVYLASPLWQLYTATLSPHAESNLLNHPGQSASDASTPSTLPKLEITVKLLTDLKFALSLPLTLAIEYLLPRHISPREFVSHLKHNHANPLSLGTKRNVLPSLPGLETQIPLLGKFLLVSGYLASQNPAKSDLRLFGRALGADGQKKKGGGTRRAGYGRLKVGKVPQRLLGPRPFPLDRLLAIFSSLYSEHAERPVDLQPSHGDSDDESDGYTSASSTSTSSSVPSERETPDSPSQQRRAAGLHASANDRQRVESTVERSRRRVERKRKRDTKREERWEEEVEGTCMSVKLWSMIPEVEARGLLRRVSPPDRLDNVMLRCEIDYESAKSLARELRMTLDEYLYEAQT